MPYLQILVESIRKNSTFKHQIILHINDGSDGTIEWANAQNDITYTHSNVNIGICKAVNLAAAMATTDYIVYINDDMYVCPDWDRYFWAEIEKIRHKYFFLSGTMIEFFDTGNPCVVVNDFGHAKEDFDEEKLLKNFQDPEKKDWSGSTWPPNIVHKDIWDMVGGYSVEFSPGMYSDPDFSMKLWNIGVRYFKGLSKSRVYHFGSKSVSRIKKNKGKDTFMNKWGLSSGMFTHIYLHQGKDFTGPLPEVKLNFTQKLMAYLKRLKYRG